MTEQRELTPGVEPKKLTVEEIERVSIPPVPGEIETAIKAREQADRRLKEKGIVVIL